jgi:hypothetical protein
LFQFAVFLNDHAAIATTLQEAGVSSAEIDCVLKAAQAKSTLLESGRHPSSLNSWSESISERTAWKCPDESPVVVPAELTGRSSAIADVRLIRLSTNQTPRVAMRLVIGGGASTRKIDPTLASIRAVAMEGANLGC